MLKGVFESLRLEPSNKVRWVIYQIPHCVVSESKELGTLCSGEYGLIEIVWRSFVGLAVVERTVPGGLFGAGVGIGF